jgi:hypothetical protein
MEDNGVFTLRKADLRLFRGLEPAFRNLLKMPDLTPEDIVGLARAIRCIQRLPQSTPGTDVSVYLKYDGGTLFASSIVMLSSDELSVEHSASSRVAEGEYESFPSSAMRIDRDGGYELEGDKNDLFSGFVADSEGVESNNEYSVTVNDDSTPVALQPFDEGD